MLIEEYTKDNYTISTNKLKLNIDSIHAYLKTSYWSENIPVSIIKKSIENSLCFGIYYNKKQVGFARVISDFSTFAYLADVFIIEEERGKGLSKWLIECILKHKELQGLRKFALMTRDAQTLYEQFGFEYLSDLKNFMQIKVNDIYKKEQ